MGGVFWIVSEVEGKDPVPSDKQGSRLINSVTREVRVCTSSVSEAGFCKQHRSKTRACLH